jgi:hypothetical protein
MRICTVIFILIVSHLADAFKTILKNLLMETIKIKSDQFITLAKAKQLVGKFKKDKDKIVKDEYKNKDLLPDSETFDRSVIDFLLAQPGCASLRIHFGMEEDEKVSLVIVGVDANDNDILTPVALNQSISTTETVETLTDPIVENGTKCPPVCPVASLLNS